MSFNRFGDGDAQPPRLSAYGVIGVVLALASLFLPAIPALAAAAGAIVLGVLARRQLKREPRTGPPWIWLIAVIVGGFVFVSQAVILAVVYFSG